MAEAPETSEISKLNRQLTRTLSNMIYEDQLDSLMRKYEEIEDKSNLLPEVQKAMMACLTIQDLLKEQSDENNPSKKPGGVNKQVYLDSEKSDSVQNRSAESLLEIQNPSSPFQDDEMEVDSADHPIGNGHGSRSMDYGSNQESSLEVANPSSCYSKIDSILSGESGHGSRSMDFGSNQENSLEVANPSSCYSKIDSTLSGESDSERESVVSLEAVNPSLDLKSGESEDFSSYEMTNSERESVGSLEAVNPSLDLKSGESEDFSYYELTNSERESVGSLEAVNPSLDLKSGESEDFSSYELTNSERESVGSLEAVNPSLDLKSGESEDFSLYELTSGTSRRTGSLDSDGGGLLAVNPSFDDIDEDEESFLPAALGENLTVADWIPRSRFNVTLKPTTLKANEFSKVNLVCSSSIDCDYWDIKACQYTVPVGGNYEFSVRKLGHQNFQCCLRKAGAGSVGEISQANSKWKRGTTKLVIRWQCSAGQTVWVEGKGQTEDCGIAVVFSGSLLNS